MNVHWIPDVWDTDILSRDDALLKLLSFKQNRSIVELLLIFLYGG